MCTLHTVNKLRSAVNVLAPHTFHPRIILENLGKIMPILRILRLDISLKTKITLTKFFQQFAHIPNNKKPPKKN